MAARLSDQQIQQSLQKLENWQRKITTFTAALNSRTLIRPLAL